MPVLPLDFLASERIFQSSDLKRDRSLIDAARGGFARLRDTDGTGLVMLPEADLKGLAAEERRQQFFAETARDLLRVVKLTQKVADGERLDPVTLGRWTWLSWFDKDDLLEFAEELATALIIGDKAAVLDALMGWEETAAVLADPERLEALTGEHDDDDYVDLARPEDGPEPAVANVEAAPDTAGA